MLNVNEISKKMIAGFVGLSIVCAPMVAFAGNAYRNFTANGAGNTRGAAENDMDNAIAHFPLSQGGCGNFAHVWNPVYTSYYHGTWWGVTAHWSC